jgi:hypothetical protein
LDEARRSPSGWRRTKLDKLFTGFGFTIEHRTKHDMAFHEDYLELRMMLPRHTKVNKVYVVKAVELIDRLQILQETERKNNE